MRPPGKANSVGLLQLLSCVLVAISDYGGHASRRHAIWPRRLGLRLGRYGGSQVPSCATLQLLYPKGLDTGTISLVGRRMVPSSLARDRWHIDLPCPNPRHNTSRTKLDVAYMIEMGLRFGQTSWSPSVSKDGLTREAKPERRRPSSGQVTLTRRSAVSTLYVVSYSPPESHLSLMDSYHDNFHQK